MLCRASKIIERHVHRSFMDYLHNRNLLCSDQSGFRNLHSCRTCLTKITSAWYKAVNEGSLVGSAALDLSRAFDVLNPDILLKKLYTYGCCNLKIDWFRSYLVGRKQESKLREKCLNMSQ